MGCRCSFTLPLLLAIALPAQAQFNPQETLPGWTPWMSMDGKTRPTYETGFSNSDASQSSAWAMYCTERATEAKTEATYWYRVSHLVNQIGTGYAEEGCLINGELISSGSLTAIKSGLRGRTCLRVNAPQGLRLYREPKLSSDRLAVLRQGSTVRVDSLPHALQADAQGQQWLYVNRPRAGWVAVVNPANQRVNLSLCR